MNQPAPNIHLEKTPEYREGYANSVQIRVNLWDFFLLDSGVVNRSAPDRVSIQNFQGVYVEPATGESAPKRAAAER